MASQCRWLQLQLLALLLFLLIALNQSHALEFMDVDESAPNRDVDDDGGDSAELPPIIHSYSKDTIGTFNPRKTDAQFRTQWERVPLQKQEVIKRR